jgi:transcriptional regulator with XRE-family HTH domain
MYLMINNYLKKYFTEKNISQIEIEKKTGISQSKISLILNGKRKLSAEELIVIAVQFDIDLNEIKKET